MSFGAPPAQEGFRWTEPLVPVVQGLQSAAGAEGPKKVVQYLVRFRFAFVGRSGRAQTDTRGGEGRGSAIGPRSSARGGGARAAPEKPGHLSSADKRQSPSRNSLRLRVGSLGSSLMEEKQILCVGLVVLDIINVVDKYPEEDTDRR